MLMLTDKSFRGAIKAFFQELLIQFEQKRRKRDTYSHSGDSKRQTIEPYKAPKDEVVGASKGVRISSLLLAVNNFPLSDFFHPKSQKSLQ